MRQKNKSSGISSGRKDSKVIPMPWQLFDVIIVWSEIRHIVTPISSYRIGRFTQAETPTSLANQILGPASLRYYDLLQGSREAIHSASMASHLCFSKQWFESSLDSEWTTAKMYTQEKRQQRCCVIGCILTRHFPNRAGEKIPHLSAISNSSPLAWHHKKISTGG